MKRPMFPAALLSVAVLAACDSEPSGPVADTTNEDLATILALASSGMQLTSTGNDGEFEIVRDVDCPESGRIEVRATVRMSNDENAGTVRSETEGEHNFVGCTIRNPRTGATRTTDGYMRAVGYTVVRLPENIGDRPQLLEQQSHQTGELTFTGEQSDTCVIDLVHTLDGIRRVARVKGTSCGVAVDFETVIPDFVQ